MTQFTDMLAAYLKGRDVNCPGCRYNLRDLECSRCPEMPAICWSSANWPGRLTTSGDGNRRTDRTPAAGSSFNGLLLLYLAVRIVFVGAHFYGGMGVFVALNAGGLAAQGAAIVCGFSNQLRRWIRRQSRTRKILARLWLLAIDHHQRVGASRST